MRCSCPGITWALTLTLTLTLILALTLGQSACSCAVVQCYALVLRTPQPACLPMRCSLTTYAPGLGFASPPIVSIQIVCIAVGTSSTLVTMAPCAGTHLTSVAASRGYMVSFLVRAASRR